jgi:hypothetical protein
VRLEGRPPRLDREILAGEAHAVLVELVGEEASEDVKIVERREGHGEVDIVYSASNLTSLVEVVWKHVVVESAWKIGGHG